jgi:hypothetical protein
VVQNIFQKLIWRVVITRFGSEKVMNGRDHSRWMKWCMNGFRSIWLHKFKQYFHEVDELILQRFHWEIRHCISWWYINFQQNWSRAFEAFSCSDEKVTVREIFDQYEEIVIYKEKNHLFGFCYLYKWIENVSEKDKCD